MTTAERFDVATGKAWLEVFASETQVDVSQWTVYPSVFKDNIRYEELPDAETAGRLAAFLAARYPVMTHVYSPAEHGYEVVALRIA